MSEDKNLSVDFIFQSVNTPAKLEDLVPLVEYLKKQPNGDVQVEMLQAFSKEADVAIEDFYFLTKHPFSPYCYYKEGVFLGFPTISKDYFQMFNLAKGLQMQKKAVNRAFETGNFSRILDIAETVSQLILFEYFYEHVKPEEKYKLFMEMYIHQEYGFTFFNPDIVEDALASQPEQVRKEAKERLKKELEVTDDARITIYRGMGAESTPIDQAMSWTTSEQTALFFANRLGAGGQVLKGTVALQDIIDYLTGRQEYEVIVRPESVTVTDGELLVDTAKEMEVLEETGMILEYQLMRQHFLVESAFAHPEGIHGMKHTKRVLLHCLSLANAIGLTGSERGILTLAACYHDIGRIHDDACTRHGQWSVEKMVELDLPSAYYTATPYGSSSMEILTMEEEQVLHFLMVYHCKPDKEAEKIIGEMEEGEIKDLIQRLLPIFKDADGLDRVRLGDLDPRYLRTKEARQRVRFAQDVLAFLE